VNQRVSEEQIQAKWREIAHYAEVLAQRSATPGEFSAQAGSDAAMDDEIMGGYNLSTAVVQGLVASIDHLDALTTLVVEHKTLHINAPYSLARGVLENAAIAFWIVHPAERPERLRRALRWWTKNANDGKAVHTAFPDAGGASSSEVMKKLEAAARANHLPTGKLRNGHTSSEAVRYSDSNAKMSYGAPISVLFPWQLCSGFAHGRPWASLGALDRKAHPTPDPTISNLRLTNTLEMTLWPVLNGFRLIQSLLGIWQSRSRHAGLSPARPPSH
jgi:hypothetical protein